MKTNDYASPIKFHVTQSLSDRKHLTAEGFLIIENVPVGRTGEMLYRPEDLPGLKGGPDGIVRVQRTADALFNPSFLASLNGKSIINNHTARGEDVTPANWKERSVGVMLNPRPGTADLSDCAVVDFLVTDPGIISFTRDTSVDVSLGYDAEYIPIKGKPGYYQQVDMIGNHGALVAKGRCGPRCSTGDRAHDADDSIHQPQQEIQMKAKPSFWERLRAAAKGGQADEVENLISEGEQSGAENPTTIVNLHGMPTQDDNTVPGYFSEHVESNNARFSALEEMISDLSQQLITAKTTRDCADQELAAQTVLSNELEAEAPEEFKAVAAKAQDSEFLADTFQQTIAAAEILAPGMRMPAFDPKAHPSKSLEVLTGIRRKALDMASFNTETRVFLDEAVGGKDLDTAKMSTDQVRTLFLSASSWRKSANNHQTRDANHGRVQQKAKKGPTTIAELNELHRAHHAKKVA